MDKFKRSTSTVKGYSTSQLAKSEKNDCFVRALAAATNVDYDLTHTYVKEVFDRKDGKGVVFNGDTLNKVQDNGIELGDDMFAFQVLNSSRITNEYKLHGELVSRMKTVKSFIKDNPTGTYVLGVSKHAFTVKDGVLIDNIDEEFRPTRKVTSAFKIDKMSQNAPVEQLKLF